jgi:N-acetylated-alpha-linked acidic dipeptidase
VIWSNATHRRGTRADFQVLKDAGIELEGKIAMANYGGIYRGTKVKNAQDNGMAGCIIFTDPMDDGEVTEKNGYDAYPSKHLCYHKIYQRVAHNS